MHLLGPLIIDQLFFLSINGFIFTNNLTIGIRITLIGIEVSNYFSIFLGFVRIFPLICISWHFCTTPVPGFYLSIFVVMFNHGEIFEKIVSKLILILIECGHDFKFALSVWTDLN